MSDLERMIEWMKRNPEAAARELIENGETHFPGRTPDADGRTVHEAAREENARLRELIDGMRSGFRAGLADVQELTCGEPIECEEAVAMSIIVSDLPPPESAS